MDFGWTSIDEVTTTSSDESTETSIDALQQRSIDNPQPEAGRSSLTNHANEGLVLGEPRGQLSNTINQTINEQGTAIPVKINSISKRDQETKLPLQDYLNPGGPIGIGLPLNYQKMIPRNPGSASNTYFWYVRTLSVEPSQSTHTITSNT